MTRRARAARPDLTRMLTVLDQECRALKRADMPAILRLAPRKEALLIRLEAGSVGRDGPDADLLDRVRISAARNARLYEAALKGLKDARALIDRYKGARSDQTYARDGGRFAVDPPLSTLERRA